MTAASYAASSTFSFLASMLSVASISPFALAASEQSQLRLSSQPECQPTRAHSLYRPACCYFPCRIDSCCIPIFSLRWPPFSCSLFFPPPCLRFSPRVSYLCSQAECPKFHSSASATTLLSTSVAALILPQPRPAGLPFPSFRLNPTTPTSPRSNLTCCDLTILPNV
jgi:hypothetical protein